jgi:plasmid maintenance system antidote protein VapI
MELTRYRATEQLPREIAAEGRRHGWIAERSGISKYLMSHIVNGRRTCSETVARSISEALGGDFDVLFKLSSDIERFTGEEAA